MHTQSPGIYIVLSGVVAAIISGAFSLWRDSINDKLQLEREKQQHTWQQESDQKEWYREKIYDSYKTSIQVLTKIVQERYVLENTYDVSQDEDINLEKLYFEFNSEFEMITAGYPDKNSEEFKERITDIRKYIKEKPVLARNIISEMMEDDSRIKV
jgi:hypothetical protein